MAKNSYDRILEKLEKIESRISDVESDMCYILDKINEKIEEHTNRVWKKAKDIPIGSKVRIGGETCEVIAYSKYGDEILVCEDEGGVTWENCNDVEIIEEN